MKSHCLFAALTLIVSSAAAAKEPMPTARELSEALAKQTKSPISPADVRPLKCEGFPEEPTEFECRWAQNVSGKWLRYSTYFAINKDGWQVIDWPPSKLK
jgi:hypothetical protein